MDSAKKETRKEELPPCLTGNPGEHESLCKSCKSEINSGKDFCEEDCEPDSKKCLSRECKR